MARAKGLDPEKIRTEHFDNAVTLAGNSFDDRLRELGEKRRQGIAMREAAQAELVPLMRQAHEKGMSLRDLRDRTGMSLSYVRDLVEGDKS